MVTQGGDCLAHRDAGRPTPFQDKPVGVVIAVAAQAVIQEIAVVVLGVGLAARAGEAIGRVVGIVYHTRVGCQAQAVADGIVGVGDDAVSGGQGCAQKRGRRQSHEQGATQQKSRRSSGDFGRMGWGRCVTQAAFGKAEYEMTDTSVCSERDCLSRAVTLSVTSPVM